MPTRVKICGITREEDARAAVELGAHALGFVFHPASPRHIEPARAAALRAALPPFVATVAVMVDPAPALVEAVLAARAVDILQFHGEESAADCARWGLPWIKAARVRPGVDLLQYAALYPGARALLLDSYSSQAHGGTGNTFDWSLVPPRLPLPVILSGGLAPDNVAAAIRALRPYGVDVSSGVEAAKGIKDRARMAAFMQGVLDADLRPAG